MGRVRHFFPGLQMHPGCGARLVRLTGLEIEIHITCEAPTYHNFYVDAISINATPGAAAGASSAAGSSGPGPSTDPSEAGPSGVQPGAAYDAQMAEPTQRRPARKHSDAPMRKLSVSLIDTYKLINQVRAFHRPI